MKTWRTWTSKEERHLIDARSRGLTIAQIATEMERTISSVKCRLQAVDAPRHSDRHSEWIHAITSGLTEREIAARMGVTKWAVKRFKQRLKGKR